MAVRKWSDEDRAFARAIHKSPCDDAPRLAYADWLEGKGDPLGKFIRLHCLWTNDSGNLKTGPLPHDEECLGLDPRTHLHRLKIQLPWGWEDPCPTWIRRFGYIRGMPHGTISWTSEHGRNWQIREQHGELCPLMVLSIGIEGCDSGTLDSLADSPLWARAINLWIDFEGKGPQVYTLKKLARFPRMADLRLLVFKNLTRAGYGAAERFIRPIRNDFIIRELGEPFGS